MALQREFRGLSDHIGLYQAGRIPIDFAPALLSQISAEDFINPPDIFRFTGVVNAQDDIVAAPVVPANEIHRVRWTGSSVTNPVGGNATLVPVIYVIDTYYGVETFKIFGGANGTTYKAGHFFAGNGILLTPGMTVGWQAQTYAGAGNANVSALYQAQVIGI